MKSYLAFILSFSFILALCQEPCISHRILQQQIQNTQDIQELNNLLHSTFVPTKNTELIIIPVVFHIIHNGDNLGENENISDSIIYEQIDRLNTDFRAKNADSSSIPSMFKALYSDTEIEFRLAKKDPNGNFTTGIVRHNFMVAGYSEDSINNYIKPQTIWDRDQYLNIWSINFSGSLAVGNVNGYATPPLASTADSTDGVVLYFQKIGNNIANNIGRTAVHEVGHWLGLFHIWGDDSGSCTGDDGIADTPNQGDNYFNCPTGMPSSCGSSDMYMNYMDYTDASCSLMFTEGQKNKMLSVLNGFRASILNSNAYNGSDIVISKIIYPEGTVCQNTIHSAVEITNIGSDSILEFGYSFWVDGSKIDSTIVYQWLLPQQSTVLRTSSFFSTQNSSEHYAQFRIISNNNEYNLNNTMQSSFQLINTGKGLETDLSENFIDDSFSNSIYIENPDLDTSWYLYQENTNQFAAIQNTSNTIGHKDAIVTTDYNLKANAINSLYFNYFYLHTIDFGDTLTVSYSLDCGVHWFPIWQKDGLSLSNNHEFDPSVGYSSPVFLFEHIELNNLGIYDKVRFKFENRSGGGNPIYLDNIFIASITDLEENTIDNIHIYPNPAKDDIYIYNSESRQLEIKLFNATGKILFQTKQSEQLITLEHENLPNGIYYVYIKDIHTNQRLDQKIIILD